MEDSAVAQGLGAERVLADRLQDPSERRVDDSQKDEEGDRDDDEHQIIGQQLAVGVSAEDRMVEPFEARLQGGGNLERAPVLPARQPGELRSEHVEGVSDRKRHHGEEDRLNSQREEANRQGQRKRQDASDDEPEDERAPCRPECIKRDADAVGAHAEEHHMGERDDPGIAEQHVVRRDEQDHHTGLGGRVERLDAGKKERRKRQRDDDQDDEDLQHPPARWIAGEQCHRPLTG